MQKILFTRHFILLFLLMNQWVFGKNFKDTVTVLPFDMEIFDFDTTNIYDIFLYDFEINNINSDTISKKVYKQYKLDSLGRILCVKTREENRYNYCFFSYKLFPKIYAVFEDNQPSTFYDLSINGNGQLEEFTVYYKEFKGNSWNQDYNAQFKYDVNSKLSEKIVNSNQVKNLVDHYDYYENGFLKRSYFSQRLNDLKDTITSNYDYIIKDNSSRGTFIRQNNDEKIIDDHIIYYNNQDKETSQIKIRTIEKFNLKEVFTHFLTEYEYDNLGRLVRITQNSYDKNGTRQPFSTVKYYQYRTTKIPNFEQIEQQNCN